MLDQNELLRALQAMNADEMPEETLEQILMHLILNPSELKVSRVRLVERKGALGVSSETREGSIINEYGIVESIKDELRYMQLLDDGTSLNTLGITRCQTCNGVVRVDNIKRCPCGRTCCISKGCAYYSKKKDIWFCTRKHASLAFFGINLRLFK